MDSYLGLQAKQLLYKLIVPTLAPLATILHLFLVVQEAQSLITFAYKIPFHNVDWPIYYGGITSLRAMLESQTLLNYDNNEITWNKVFFIVLH